MTALRQQALSDVNAMKGAFAGLGQEFDKLTAKQKAYTEGRDLFLAKERGKPIMIEQTRQVETFRAEQAEARARELIEQKRQVELRNNAGKEAEINQKRDYQIWQAKQKLARDIEAAEQKYQAELAKNAKKEVEISQNRDYEIWRSEQKFAKDREAIEQKRQTQLATNAGKQIDIERRRQTELYKLDQQFAAEREGISQKRDVEKATAAGRLVGIQQRREVESAIATTKAEDDKVRAARAAAAERLAIETALQRQLGILQSGSFRAERAGQQAQILPGGGGSLFTQRAATAQKLLAEVQGDIAAFGGAPASPAKIQELRNALTGMEQALKTTKAASVEADSTFGSFFGKMGRYAQIAGGLTVVYGAMRAVFAGVQEYIEVDKQLARIAATMDRNKDRASTLSDAYGLMVKANQTLGTSFSEAGKVVFELEKALGNIPEEIQAAFMPALTLMSLGEGNQTEILRTLIGTYKLFGDTLGNISPQEKYLRISDALIASSAASIQDIDGFRTALQNVAPVAQQAGVSLEATLASLVVLTNGMQSASRAGTGLRQLLVDLQTRPGAISKIFDVPFDPDAPLNATKLLDTIIQKIRQLGTDSVRTQAMINAAFPDKRATLAFETLIALYPQYSKALNEVESAAGRTAAAQRELANTISAAMGRLSGALFTEAINNMNALLEIKPGSSTGAVKAIDDLTLKVKALSDQAQDAIIYLRQLYAIFAGEAPTGLPGGVKVDPQRGLSGQNPITQFIPGLSFPTPPPENRQKPQALKDFEQYISDVFKGFLSPETKKAIADLGKLRPASRAEQEARDTEFQARNAEFAAASPPEGSAARLEILKKLTEDLLARKQELFEKSNLEFTVSDKSLDYSRRIAAADALVIQAKKDLKLAEDDYDTTASLRSVDIVQLEKYRGELDRTIQALERRKQVARDLRAESAQEAIDINKETGAQAERNQKAVDDAFAKMASVRAQLKDNTALERAIADVNRLGDALNDFQFVPMTPEQFSNINKQYREIGDSILRYWVDPLVAITKLDYENTWDAFNRGLDKSIRDAELLAGVMSRLGQIAPSVELVRERSLERQLGLDTINESLQNFRNEIGFTREEWVANMAAMKAGAKDFLDLLAKADDPDIDEETRSRLRSSVRIIRDKVVPGSTDLITEQIKKDTQESLNQLNGLRDGYGQVGAELDKYLLARDRYKKSFDELTPEEQKQIERLARTTEQLKNAAAAAGLVAIGFSKIDAEAIAKRAADVSSQQAQIATGIEQIRTLNNAGEVARQQMEAFLQESTRATGDFVGFFISKMRDAANTGTDFWTLMGTLAEETSKAMSSSLSDFFFDVFTGKTNTAKKIWEDFLTSILRSISNFLAQAATRAFINLLFGSGGARSFSINGSVGGGGGGGGGDFSNSPDAGLVAGLATNVLRSYLGGTTGGATGGGGGLIESLIGLGGSQAVSSGTSAVSGGGVTGGAGIVGGVVNAGTNFAVGGVQGVALGVPTVVANGTTIVVPAGTQGYALAELGAVGVDATAGAGTSGLIGAGGTIASATVVLAALAAAYSLYTGVTGLEENKQGTKGYNAALGTLSGVGAGAAAGALIGTFAYPVIGTVAGAIIGAALGGTAGNLLGGLFGSDPDMLKSYREREETATAYRRVDQFLTVLAPAASPQEFEGRLLAQAPIGLGGTKGGIPLNEDDQAISIGLKNLVFTTEQFLQALKSGQYILKTGTPIPQTAEELAALLASGGTGQAYSPAPGMVSVPLVNIGQQNQFQDVLAPSAFTEFVKQYGQPGLPGADTSISSNIQVGVNPLALEQANYAIIQTILAKLAAFDELNKQVNNALNEVLKETITPISTSLGDVMRHEAAEFRNIVNGLIFANRQSIATEINKLNTLGNPVEIIDQIATIRGLIEARYTEEIELVQKFADALDQLAEGFKQASQSIEDQIAALNASNLGPTNPMEVYRQASLRFGEARSEFLADPTPQTAARLQERVDPLLQAAGNLYTRPSMEYQEIFQTTIGVLEDAKAKVDEQAKDITDALRLALGDAGSIEELTERNTRLMAEDMRALRLIAEQRLTALGFEIAPAPAIDSPLAPTASLFNPTSQLPGGSVSATLTSTSTADLAAVQAFAESLKTSGMIKLPSSDEEWRQLLIAAGLPSSNDYIQYIKSLPSAETGARYTHEGIYYLHEGERVLPRAEAEVSRRGDIGNLAMSLTIAPGAINIHGSSDPNATGRAVVEMVENSIRSGRLGRVISDRVRSKV